MADAAHLFGSDLSAGPTGDLAISDGSDEGRDRVLRRLLTVQGDYIWHLDYGAGLPAFIGQPVPAATLQGRVQAQMFLEAGVQQSPPPRIDVQSSPDGAFFIQAQYVDAVTTAPVALAFDVSP